MCRSDRYRHLTLILSVAILPAGFLLTFLAINVYNDAIVLASDKYIVREVLFSMEIGEVLHHLQLESDESVIFIRHGNLSGIDLKLSHEYEKVDDSLNKLSRWPLAPGTNATTEFSSSTEFRKSLKQFRGLVQARNTSMKDIIRFYNFNNHALIEAMTNNFKTFSGGIAWHRLVGYILIVFSEEEAGIEGAIGESILLADSFQLETLLWFHEKLILGNSYLNSAQQYASIVKEMITSLYIGTDLEEKLTSMREEILDYNITADSVDKALMWFGNVTEYLNILKTVQDALGQEIIVLLNDEIRSIETNLIISVVIMTGSIILSPLIIISVYKLTKKLQVFAESLQKKTSCLEQERKRSEMLLYQMLPVTVAKKLIDDQSVMPECYTSVTIYFSDIVGFTSICCHSSPMQVVEMLNLIYKTFDDRLEVFDVYKVETIGDAYMVASGLPQRNGNRHIAEISFFALDIMGTISELHVPHLQDHALSVRIGINTGPVVAGVVGHKMPRYCLFGDTVNVASRMESSGEPSKIQISETTNIGLSSFQEFITCERGNVHVKGKGTLKTYWLVGRKGDSNAGSRSK